MKLGPRPRPGLTEEGLMMSVRRVACAGVVVVIAALAAGPRQAEAAAACQCTRPVGGASCCDWNCQFSPANTVCRPALGPCDVADTCSGSSAVCSDNLAPAGTLCGTAPAATCSGSSRDCLSVTGAQTGGVTFCASPDRGVPTGVTAVPGDGRVSLSWAPVLGAARYNVKRGFGPGALSTIATALGASFTDASVTNLATYYYAVSAVNGASGVESNDSIAVSALPAPFPPPASLAAVAGNGTVALSWTAVAGASSYRPVRDGVPLAAVAGTSYTDAGLTNGRTYSYYVYASGPAGGEGAHSSTVSATPVGPPAAPTALVAVAGGTQVTLTWSAQAGVTGYAVSRSTTPGAGFVVVGAGLTTTSFVDPSLAAGTTYYYVVQAANAFGTGAFSAQVQATTAPVAPTGVAATAAGTQVSVTWAAATGATSYNVFRSTSAGAGYALASNGSPSTSFVDGGLLAGTAYYYTVEASNAAGVSARTAPVFAVTIPAAPARPTASAPLASQVTVAWPGVAGATRYTLKRSTSAVGPFTAVASGIVDPRAGWVDAGLAAGTTYFYVASASNAAGESGDSPAVTALTRPASPTLATPVSGSGYLVLSWTAVGSATQYSLKRATVSGGPYATVATVTASPYTDTAVTNGTTFYYVVTATNGSGEGAASAQVAGRPSAPRPPPKPECPPPPAHCL